MKIGCIKETLDEKRIALLPQVVEKLTLLNSEVLIEQGLGANLQIPDEAYKKAKAQILDKKTILQTADIILRVKKPSLEEIALLKKGAIYISFLDPFNEPQILDAFIQNNITAISMEMIPRTTIAQKMDALSSQATLAGYAAVILASEQLPRILPMMTTAATTISPAKVFIIGAGVAGLQAIATAHRLGARVDAFDTRAAVEEQVKSLGARFVKIDLGKTEETKQGYAKELTTEQLEKQKQEMTKVLSQSDITITTALIFGKKAPRIITQDMIKQMKPSSIIVDMAVETGGNVEGSALNKTVECNGVKIISGANLAGKVADHASLLYAFNLYSLLQHFWDKEKGFQLKFEDEIIKSSVITHNGKKLFGVK
ncbi:MAG: NAD(P) transhydrogenase subunit alpha [Chlamydiae bacterium]|nr:NAD(P) transhydrogenase subunit alpha [Chlamydiota bacterium]